jgi:HlyD family secretion protein
LSIPREQRPGRDAVAVIRRGRPVLVTLLVLAVLGLGGYVAWTKYGDKIKLPQLSSTSSTPATPIRTIKVVAQSAPDRGAVLTATGKIVSDHQVEVFTKVSGQIVALHFEQGDRVKRGQILAEIEDIIPRARRDEVASQIARGRAKLEYDKINLARTERLAKIQQASEIELADARRAAAETEAEVKVWESTLVAADKTLNDCKVVAPIAGVILERNVEVGDFVAAEGGRGANANAQFGIIADMDVLRVEVDVSELDVSRLHTDMPCVIAPDSQKDRKYQGHVMWLDPGANYAKATVQVKVRILNPDEFLRVEGAAQVFNEKPDSADTSAQAAALWIPQSAVRTSSDGSTSIFVAEAGRWRALKVTLGRKSGDSIEVTTGLVSGAEIAADQVEKIREGDSVKP